MSVRIFLQTEARIEVGRMRDRDDSELKPGMRIRLSALGKVRSPRIKVHTGVIVGKPPGSEGVRIMLDGSKTPITLHESYIEL
jgi:hypothetical protein